MRRALLALGLAATLPIAAYTFAFAQEEEKGWLVTYVEDTISTPDRKISLGTIDGALSSDVRISDITIADRQGVWLTINGVHLVWNRSALLGKKLDIDLLEAQSIVITRAPLPPEGVQPASTEPFNIPDLPVALNLTRLTVPQVQIAASLAGKDTVLSVEGGAQVEAGVGHADLAIKRTQPSGGDLTFKADYSNATRQLDLALSLQEPKDGFLSNLLNVPGHPSLSFTVAGSGPLDNFAAEIGLSADGDKLLGGKATISQGAGGYAFTADLDGRLGRLVDPALADFLGGNSQLSLAAHQTEGGGFELEHAKVHSGVLDLALAGRFSPDGFPLEIKADGTLAAADGKPVHLPGSQASLASAKLATSFAEGQWTASFDLDALDTGTVKASHAALRAGGQALDLADVSKRSLTFSLDGRAEGLAAVDPGLQKALGADIVFSGGGRWQAGQPATVDSLRLTGAAGEAGFAGKLDGHSLVGHYGLKAPDLRRFSGLAGRDLAGKADLEADGDIGLVGGALSLKLDGKVDGLAAGDPTTDKLLKGTTTLNGGLVRDEEGLHFTTLTLANPQLQATLDGLLGVRRNDLKAKAQLAEIGLVTERAGGAARLDATLSGKAEAPTVALELSSDNLMLQGKPLRAAAARFKGTLGGGALNGDFDLAGVLDSLPVNAAATIATLPDGTQTLKGLSAKAGAASLTGDITLRPDKRIVGNVSADIPDMASIAPLLLTRASGLVKADIVLTADDGRQNAAVKAKVQGLKLETTSIGSADIDLSATDLTGVPALAGKAAARAVSLGSFVIADLQASAERQGAKDTAFRLSASLPRGSIATAGAVAAAGDGYDVRLDKLDLKQDGIAASLAKPMTLASRKTGLTIKDALLRLGQGGTVALDGVVADRLALTAVVTSLPASLANAFSPGLGAAGTLSATAKIGGTPASPTAEFSLRGEGLSAAALRSAGVPALGLTATGRYADKAATVEANATGAGGIALRAAGRVPLAGGGLALDVSGSLPLALADVALRERGAHVTGTLSLAAKVGGSLSSPLVSGEVRIAGASVSDPQTATKLTAVTGVIRLAGDRATIESLTAATQGGGTLSVSGSIGLKGDLPADLAIALGNAKLSDGSLATVQLSGNLTVRGGLMAQPALGGRLTIARAEITIPERFAANAALLGVKHLAPPPAVQRTLAKAKAVAAAGKRRGHASGNIVLDLTIDAPARVFVRGRGLDAELGGQLTLRGPISNVSPVGSFELRRGGVDVIGQHINFDSGSVVLTGDLNPTIDFAATTRTSSITVTARITGQALDPQIVLSSDPELPQDEVLSHFLFGRSIQELSPLQIVQLATAVAQLAGGPSGPDLLGSIRKATGLDSLGIVTDDSGNAALQAGRYIGEKIYLGVTAGQDGQMRGTVNLDVTKSLKLRGEAGTDGGKAGVYYEQEY